MTIDLNLSGGPFAAVDRAALRHNLQVVRSTAPKSKVLAVVKANAYGHGLVQVAQALISTDGFGVARLREAIALRESGIGQPIVLLEGVFSHAEFDAAARMNFELVVHSFEQIDALETWHASKPLSVWCKIDTGMNRLGFRVEDFPAAWSRLNACRNVQSSPRVMTHLADADERDDSRTSQQIERFDQIAKDLNVERSIGNSAGTLAWPDSRVEWVRPGLMLYGMSPFADSVAGDFNLQPAMTLTTPLITVREVKAGEQAGYGGTWQASMDTRVGIAAVGYGDGYPRHLKTGAPVLIRGQRAKIVGRVSMDMIAIDLSPLGESVASMVMPGDTVVLWGKGLPAEEVAIHADTIPYELVCGISQRVAMGYR
ncbi:MAG: alanine racemase [Steroidobacter sp.]